MINKDELLFVVDENNNPIEPRPRREAHLKGIWHRVSQVWIINSNNQILCQKRSMLKDSNPGGWEPFFGGHMAPGVEYLDGVKIEMEEELGINLDDNKLKLWKVYKNINAKEFEGVFVYRWDGGSESLKFEVEEIDQIKWIDFEEVTNFVLSKEDNNQSKMGYEKELFETEF